MKIKVNRNILWAETFVNELVRLGVKYVCISPGSRSSALTIAFSKNNKVNTFVNIDERVNAFFALGLAKASNSPVVLVCTSGTATAEFYPAIIEAYQYHVPLIVCTADRPPELLNRGANQTINQDNLYGNHINWYFNAGLPEPNLKSLRYLKSLTNKAFFECTVKQQGPIHINFPFRKPLEPFLFTDEVSNDVFQFSQNGKEEKALRTNSVFKTSFCQKDLNELFRNLYSIKKGIIICGPDDKHKGFPELCSQFASIMKYPIVADGLSQLRFGKHSKENIISNFEGIFRSENFINKNQPELILQFGKTPTSKGLELFYENSTAKKFLINDSGSLYDPAGKALSVIEMNTAAFCKLMIEKLKKDEFNNTNTEWQNKFLQAESISTKIKSKVIDNALFPFEGRIISETINSLSDDSVLMISNSMPVRDLDYFAQKTDKSISVYNNRGASGIDGITSTALGISAAVNKPTVLITGDLAFYYDLNGLLASKNYKIPLVIILINNNGGGIFEMLPISKYRKTFNDYFLTPHNLNFAPIVKAYDGNFIEIHNWEHFQHSLLKAQKSHKLSVLEIKTNSKKSAAYRKKYWDRIDKELQKH